MYNSTQRTKGPLFYGYLRKDRTHPRSVLRSPLEWQHAFSCFNACCLWWPYIFWFFFLLDTCFSQIPKPTGLVSWSQICLLNSIPVFETVRSYQLNKALPSLTSADVASGEKHLEKLQISSLLFTNTHRLCFDYQCRPRSLAYMVFIFTTKTIPHHHRLPPSTKEGRTLIEVSSCRSTREPSGMLSTDRYFRKVVSPDPEAYQFTHATRRSFRTMWTRSKYLSLRKARAETRFTFKSLQLDKKW